MPYASSKLMVDCIHRTSDALYQIRQLESSELAAVLRAQVLKAKSSFFRHLERDCQNYDILIEMWEHELDKIEPVIAAAPRPVTDPNALSFALIESKLHAVQ